MSTLKLGHGKYIFLVDVVCTNGDMAQKLSGNEGQGMAVCKAVSYLLINNFSLICYFAWLFFTHNLKKCVS